MSFISSEHHPNPDDPNDPLYYAPRSARSEANLRSDSALQTRPVRPVSSRSGFDEMLEEAVAKSLRHPLEPEVVYRRDRPRARFRLVGSAAAIGVSAIVAFVFFTLVPKSQGGDPPKLAISEFRIVIASVEAAKITPEESRTLLQKFEQSVASAVAPKITRDESRTLLQKFEQWRQRQ